MKKIFEALSAILICLCIVDIMLWSYKVGQKLDAIHDKQERLEKRVDNVTQALKTKDKELENGLRNNYNGLMYKIEWLEKQVVE